jgi:radical SAM protein with 4Fe4S-binding SPASM domain
MIDFEGLEEHGKKTVEGIKNCVKVGICTGIATTITRYNYRDVSQIIDFAKKLGVEYFMAFNFIPTRRGKEIEESDITPEEREKLLNFLYEKLCEESKLKVFSTCPAYARISLEHVFKDKNKPLTPTHFANVKLSGRAIILADFLGGCGAGREYCSIEYNGDIQPCVFIPIKLGNIINDGFEKVWKNNEILESLRSREFLKGPCNNCEYKYVCGGCRARAFATTNDILESDYSCLLASSSNFGTKEEFIKLFL